MFGFPTAGEARVVTDGTEAYVIAWMPRGEAQKVANGLAAGDFTKADLAAVVGNAAVVATMPGRLSRVAPPAVEADPPQQESASGAPDGEETP